MDKKRPRLRIAQIAPLAERVPPKKYGGTERVVHSLTEELVRRGHDVTLFATGDSKTSAKLSSVYPRGLREAKVRDPHGLNEWSWLHIASAYIRQDEFDVIHDHNSIISLPTAQLATTPTVVTIHGPITLNNRRLYKTIDNPHYVTISNSQTSYIPGLKNSSMVYNGLPLEEYPFHRKNKGYLLFVGRISMEKGVHHAIDVALELNLPLIIAAKVDKADRDYFQGFIEPRLNEEQINWIGEVDEDERNRLMSNALCFLHPVTWREPFGLTMIEAMACGCPVVGFNRGSIPEIIKDGVSGFVASDVEEMIEAVDRISEIDRSECRKYALDNFSDKKMADGYEDVYYKVIEERKKMTP